MKKIGITGGIGSGKSTVCRVFALLGAAIYDSDREAKRLMNSDPRLTAQIRELFGPEAYQQGQLNRPFLASVVFHNPERLTQLNALVHPAVAANFAQWAEKQSSPYVIEESAILFEAGVDRNMDETVAVVAPEALRIQRTCLRDHSDEAAVRARMARQMSDQERMARADHILVADEKRLLIPQIIELHKRFIQ